MARAFAIDANHDWDAPAEKYLDKEELGDQYPYAESLITALLTKRDYVDSFINEVSDGWTTGRMAKADLAILRVACCEILYLEDVPKAVAINEAVELSKLYGTPESGKFINAILGKIDG